ncbi:sugar phosphate isomerase/epimerase family protein [Pseudarthrobacter raffinosi]|uniref:sugar phosphate isomerase/epimerase family protein n=1 Tax=Pseudarthrobacter raffinosi TaxID=2953651 RepID=UPI00208E1B0C|nr:sugar phosphate isomerase/epimerase family protein [Pseudarthrobacter sp. MDT3-26]MCO4261583.1 sugar phosphate isomerase/epimerase [Pseudarthrobacter sp. MDT3-26]
MTLITVQEQHLPGTSLEEKFDQALAWGFDGIELRSAGGLRFQARLPELRRARDAGVVMPTACVEMPHFVGAFDDELRKDAVVQLKSQLSVMAEIGGRGVMTPASYGMFSKRLPPFIPSRSEEEDTAVLVESFTELGEHAAAEGVEIYLEPLNRYEDHMINTLADGVRLLTLVGLDAVRLAPDTYHMNIEESDPAAALQDAAGYIGHIQASDSNRLEPGAGHIDWALFGATLKSIGYQGTVALESRLSGPAEEVLPRVPSLLGRYL